MRHYEIATIQKIELDDSDLAALTEMIESWIVEAGGEVVAVDNWGRRKLAYPIKKQQEGHYVFWYVNLPPAAPVELERHIRLNEDVLRFMVTRAELQPPPEEETIEEEQEHDDSADDTDYAGEEDTDDAIESAELADPESESTENDGAASAPVT